MTKERLFTIFFLAFFVLILFLAAQIFSPFFTTALWAFVIVFAFFPVYVWLEKRLGGHKTLSALIMTLLIFAVVVVPAVYLILYLSSEALSLYFYVKKLVTTGEWQQFLEKIRSFQIVKTVEKEAPQWSFIFGDGLSDTLLNASKTTGNFLAINLAKITKNIIFFILHFLLLICFSFFFFRYGRDIFNYWYHIFPMQQDSKTSLIKSLNNTLTAIIRGQFLTSIAQGVLAGVIFYFLGVKLFVFFGILTFVTSMVPVIGAASVWAPIAIYFSLSGRFEQGVILFFAGFFGISLLDNILKPLLIGGHTKMSVLLIFLSILGGIAVYGISGIIIGPVILAVFFALVKIFKEQYLS